MTYDVILPIPASDAFWYKGIGSDLLKPHRGRISTGAYTSIHPQDFLIEWMQDFTPSWVYYHTIDSITKPGEYLARPIGVLFAFEDSAHAVLFKLRWG